MAFLTVCLNPTIQKTLRFSTIIPGTVNRAASHRVDVSGKGINVTRVLTQLGKKALHLTQLGGVMKPLFLSLCEKDGVSVEWAESGSEIRFCYTALTDNAVTELVEESQPAAAGTEDRIIDKFDTLIKEGFKDTSVRGAETESIAFNTIIISGTKAAGFSDNIYPYMTKKAKTEGLRVILDVKSNDLINCLKHEPDIIKPNLFEFASTFAPDLIKDNDAPINDDKAKEKIKSAVIDIALKYRCLVILTNGSREITAANKDNFYEIDIPVVKAVNTIGCGDAFTAGLASAIDNGAAIKEAVNEGIRCGALNARLEKPGVIM
ncbi:MAG: PfkB family carbohydrate kinase [Treponema sp.]|nr:PfkB family carbohydrate kinase [Treponema sp.]